ncbi:Fc.00g092360.m01.CDS01 [Cosmosporella sp. VM-42]
MVVKHVKSRKEYDQILDQAAAEDQPVLVDAFAEWCGPCKAISPKLEQWSNSADYKNVVFVKIDVDELPDLSQDLGIRAMPTFILFKNKEKIGEVVGANPPGILKALAPFVVQKEE